MIGQTLLHYRITEKLGAGGMGEVYRATDTKLGRDVAIKVLPEAFARDKERLARFEREARVLASLNHPNIAAIHGFEQAGGVHFLVLEYVPGPTLAETLAAGPSELEETLRLSSQIAEALEAAHEKGVVHRDLKPANVKVTPEGKVKVLDFGLAKALAEDPSGDPTQSPTLTAAATRAGVIMGTAAYMSPEQARGRALDKRTDVWSFGCVLYEMLTGHQAFGADNITDIIAAVVKSEPDWNALPAATPAGIQRLLRRCLEKDPARRLRDIGDARMDLEEALTTTSRTAISAPMVAAVAPRARFPVPVLVAGLFGGALLAGLGVWFLKPPPPAQPRFTKRLMVTLPPGDALDVQYPIAISRDGARVSYRATRGGRAQLFLRSLDQPEPVPVRGSDNGYGPFFSPDGQWLGFFAEGMLKKAPVTGGASQSLCSVTSFRGATWGPDDTIVFGAAGTPGLQRVPAAGGKPEVLTTPDPSKSELLHRFPAFLPGGKALLYAANASAASWEDAKIVVESLETKERRVLVEGGTHPSYLATGHLVYLRTGSLMAVAFDPTRMQLTGKPAPVLESLLVNSSMGWGLHAVSSDGSLAYIPGGAGANFELVWVDRKGAARPASQARGVFHDIRLSPDGRQAAVNIAAVRNDLWVHDLQRDVPTRLTFEAENHTHAWSPDGKRIAFASDRGGKRHIYSKPADGSSPEEVLYTTDNILYMNSWSPDGRELAFAEVHPSNRSDILILPLDGDRKPRPFLQTPFNEGGAMFSPDGRFIAYQSNESGPQQVYVQPFPGPGGKWQISTEGGVEPIWSRNGRELFYRTGDKVMAVDVQTRPNFSAGRPKMLFEGRYRLCPGQIPYWDISPDGQRFLMIKIEDSGAAQLLFVVDWFEELRRRVGPTQK